MHFRVKIIIHLGKDQSTNITEVSQKDVDIFFLHSSEASLKNVFIPHWLDVCLQNKNEY
jgi:hypothetical protein